MENQKQRIYDELNKMGIKYEVVEHESPRLLKPRLHPQGFMPTSRGCGTGVTAVLSGQPRFIPQKPAL